MKRLIAAAVLALASNGFASGLVPRGHQTIVDQLRRASISTVLNIAEATGHPYVQKRRNHYAIERGSALECGAALDTCKVLEIGEQNHIPVGKTLLVSVVSMLSKMSRG